MDVPSLTDWAADLIKRSVIPDARPLARVYHVEAGAICFTTRRPGTVREVAKTALIRPSQDPKKGTIVYRVVPGWPCLDIDPGHVIQGPINA